MDFPEGASFYGFCQVRCIAYCFFNPIVEVVTEGRANVRFDFNSCNELVIFHDDQISSL